MFVLVLFLFGLILNINSLEQISVYQPDIRNETHPRFTYTWPNGTVIRFNLTLPSKPQEVDCLGLGSSVAQGLEWLFRPSDSHKNALDVRFFVRSKNHPERVEVLVGDQFGLEHTFFKIERKTIIIVHGFLSHGDQDWIQDMLTAFLEDDVNVIVVDWSAHGNTWNYYKAAVYAKSVGRQIAEFLSHVVNETLELSINSVNSKEKINWGPIHMVGHSLGAHICGITANEFQKITSLWKIMRITGLDPAQPCFTHTAMSLDVTDAKFVDVIHTNARLLSKLGLGLPQPIGHVDFYPNGGRDQLGCLNPKVSVYDYLGIPKSSIKQAICSHGRSYIYFTDSIIASRANNGTFWGHIWDRSYRRALQIMDEPCDSIKCIEMGINAEKYSLRGSFFVATSSSRPFYDVSANDRLELKKQLRIDFDGEQLD